MSCRSGTQKKGALRVLACVTHPLFSKSALEKIENSEIEELIVTDTIPFRKEIMPKNIVQISLAPLIAEAIKCSLKNQSINFLFDGAK